MKANLFCFCLTCFLVGCFLYTILALENIMEFLRNSLILLQWWSSFGYLLYLTLKMCYLSTHQIEHLCCCLIRKSYLVVALILDGSYGSFCKFNTLEWCLFHLSLVHVVSKGTNLASQSCLSCFSENWGRILIADGGVYPCDHFVIGLLILCVLLYVPIGIVLIGLLSL